MRKAYCKLCDFQAQERRIKALEREVDAAVAAAAHARAEKKQAEAAQHAAEARTKEFLQELDDTTRKSCLCMGWRFQLVFFLL